MTTIAITRRVEFDAGHRIPDHKSKCRNFHGHRYVLEASFIGPVKNTAGASDNGMVQDFGDLKGLLNLCVADEWDHGFLVHNEDRYARKALACLDEGHKTVVLGLVPTVENLVMIAANRIVAAIAAAEPSSGFRGVELQAVRLYETPNCWADWSQGPRYLRGGD